MRKKLILPTLIALLAAAVVSCNSKSDYDYESAQSSSVIVSAFSLKNNTKVLDSLSNVYFTIDLEGARIFNADSLPYGTKVNRLLPSITTATYASKVELTYRVPETGRDSVVNYLKNSGDSIDFSGGPVKLSITSQDGHVTRNYEIRVNVHQVKSDSLAWYAIATATLPGKFSSPTAQRTAMLDGTYYSLTSAAEGYCVATTTDPATPEWTIREVTLPFNADVESLSASDKALYILDDAGHLHTSDDCADWTDTGLVWSHIYGGYGDDIIGVRHDNGTYTIECFPSGKTMPLPEGMPVDGTTQLATYTLPMGNSMQAVMLGGRLPDGSLCSVSWAYDGDIWAPISRTGLPYGLQDMTLVAYRLSEMRPTNWTPQSYPVLLALGGRNHSGAVNRSIYYSRDWGMTWKVAPAAVKQPAALTSFYGATAFCHTTVMYPASRTPGHWTELPVNPLQDGCAWDLPASRAVAPISQWDCPAIYVFGGRNPDGETLCTLWRGVILQFTFEPVI